MTRQPCLFIAASLLALSHIGCSSFRMSGPGRLLKSSNDAVAVRCLCLWQPVETEDITGLPVRGFGGQVYFFSADSEEPVTADGAVSVFVFDDIGTPAEQARPKDIQKYDSLTWKSFQNESQVGTNYSLFVPYKSTSKSEAVCSLRLRLTRPDGSHLFSDMASIKLAGEPREDKSIRQLVSPREHSIRPDRSRELRVNFDPNSISTSRVATIGSIREGGLSLIHEDRTKFSATESTERRSRSAGRPNRAHTTVDQASHSVQQYQEKLAEMHAAFERSSSGKRRTASNLSRDISDLLPAIQRVSGQKQHHHRQVSLSAHEVFSAEEIPPFEASNSQSEIRVGDDFGSQLHKSRAQSIFGSGEGQHVQPLALDRIQN